MHYVQYDKKTGKVTARVSTGNAPVILPEMSIAQLEFEDFPADAYEMRVNLETLELEPCPEIAKTRANGEIYLKLAALDVKKQRALFDGLRNGDWEWYDKHEAAAEELRKKIIP